MKSTIYGQRPNVFFESPEIYLISRFHTHRLNCVKGVKKYTNVTGLGKDMQQPPFRASYKQMDFDVKLIALLTFINVEYDCIDTTRTVATFPISNGIFIHPWFLVKANAQGLLCIKGAGTAEAAVFSKTQFGADQNGSLETLSLPIYFHS